MNADIISDRSPFPAFQPRRERGRGRDVESGDFGRGGGTDYVMSRAETGKVTILT